LKKLIILIFYFLSVESAWSGDVFLRAKILKVYDANTIEALVNGKKEGLSPVGMEAPVLKIFRYEGDPFECWSRESAAEARRLLEGKDVILELEENQIRVRKRDDLSVYIWVNGLHYNLHMIKNGFAVSYEYRVPYLYRVVYRTYSYEYRRKFIEAENEAVKLKKGLWKACE
jgi:endonuclease YncB( thermonuclease family)